MLCHDPNARLSAKNALKMPYFASELIIEQKLINKAKIVSL